MKNYLIVGIRFKRAGKIYYFDPNNTELRAGMGAIVETTRGVEYGQVILGNRYVPESDVALPLRPIVRMATPEDLQQLEDNKRLAADALPVCQQRVEAFNLNMNLIDAEYTFDRSKLLFYFAAEGRIDFRELVRDLASIFHARIELRQIGVRDEAKMLNGLGPCGRPLCCSTWLGDFAPVSIKMAKDQGLSLNPAKISGLCGRLMCCLKYEYDNYESQRDDMTVYVGSKVATTYGEGVAINVRYSAQTVLVKLNETSKTMEFNLEDVAVIF